MSEVRYLTDEHVSRAVALGLRARGVDVVTVQEVGRLGASDVEHLASALAASRVIFTHDDDFLRLAARGVAHAGLVFAPRQLPIGGVIRGLILIAHVWTAEEMIGRIEFI